MSWVTKQSVGWVTVGLMAFVVVGCQEPEHRMAQPKPDTKMGCQLCYDEVSTIRRTPPRSGTPWNVVVRKHMCPECKDEMSVYRENGVLMVKCARCAPEGLACDRCLPPDAPVR